MLRELKPRWQMTQRIRPVDEEGVAEEEEGEHEEGPSQGWESSGEKKKSRRCLKTFSARVSRGYRDFF